MACGDSHLQVFMPSCSPLGHEQGLTQVSAQWDSVEALVCDFCDRVTALQRPLWPLGLHTLVLGGRCSGSSKGRPMCQNDVPTMGLGHLEVVPPAPAKPLEDCGPRGHQTAVP